MNHTPRRWSGRILGITWVFVASALCSHPAQARSRSIEMRIPNAVLAQYIRDARDHPKTAGISLPVLRVFSKDGALIDEISGFSGKRQLRHELLRAMRRNRTLKGTSTLAAYLRKAVTEDGKPYKPGRFVDADFVLVENWASWCAPCTLQHTALQKFIASQSDRNIVLVHLETDIMRAVRSTGGTVIHRTD